MSATTDTPTTSSAVDQRAAMATGRPGCACQGRLCASPPVARVPHPAGGTMHVSLACKARLEGRESAWGPGEGYDPTSDNAPQAAKASAQISPRPASRRPWPSPNTCAAHALLAIADGESLYATPYARKSVLNAICMLRRRKLLFQREHRLTARGMKQAARLRGAE